MSDLDKRLSEARDKMREAEEAVHSAIVALRSASQRLMQVEAVSAGQAWQDWIIGHAAGNRATWSGGALSAANIVESAKREAAIDLLRSPPYEVRKAGCMVDN